MLHWIEPMTINPKILNILACPQCKTDVKLTSDEKGLKCVTCHRVYPIKEDIPIMLIDEASIEPGRETKD
jgi:uncharacterized protein YbaR (Trm112 family)